MKSLKLVLFLSVIAVKCRYIENSQDITLYPVASVVKSRIVSNRVAKQ